MRADARGVANAAQGKGDVMSTCGMNESPIEPCADAKMKATVGDLSQIIAEIMMGKISPAAADQQTDRSALATSKPNEN